MLAEAVHLALAGLGTVAAMMFALWLVHLLIRNAAIVDVGWAAGLATLAVFYAIEGPGYSARKWAIATMAGFWGLRLAMYLFFSRVLAKPEEGRYVQLRREWKTNLQLRFLFFFEFQALLTVVLSLPFLLASLNTIAPLGWLEKIGAGIWLVSICGEAVADYQLNRFRKNPANKGKTCRRGLWGYSRHPNYFFEFAAPELFFRVDDLGELCDFCAGLAVGLARADFAGADAVLPAGQHRHCGHRSTSAAYARSGVPRLPEDDEHVYSVVSEEKDGVRGL